jgi:hypothetical protein
LNLPDRVGWALLGLVWTFQGIAATAEIGPGVERNISAPGPGKVVLTLDQDVYESARSDLGDLRVIDEQGTETPYLLERVGEAAVKDLRPHLTIRRTFVKGQGAEATLDFGGPILKSEVQLSLSGDDFRRRVVIEGRNRHEPWVTLVDGAYVFAISGHDAARYETLRVPENNYRFLKVRVMDGPQDPDRIEILDVRIRRQAGRRPKEVGLVPQLTIAEDVNARETLLTLDLGARYQPFRGVALDLADPEFFRGARLEAEWEAPGAPPRDRLAPPLAYSHLAEGIFYRYPEGEGARESLRLDAVGRARLLRLRILNRDQRPLSIRGASVWAPVERLVFEAAPGHAYRLTYGYPALGPPSYQVARTVGDPAIWMALASQGRLEVPVRVTPAPAQGPWTQRVPSWVWAGLLAVLALVGALIWRAMKTAR